MKKQIIVFGFFFLLVKLPIRLVTATAKGTIDGVYQGPNIGLWSFRERLHGHGDGH